MCLVDWCCCWEGRVLDFRARVWPFPHIFSNFNIFFLCHQLFIHLFAHREYRQRVDMLKQQLTESKAARNAKANSKPVGLEMESSTSDSSSNDEDGDTDFAVDWRAQHMKWCRNFYGCFIPCQQRMIDINHCTSTSESDFSSPGFCIKRVFSPPVANFELTRLGYVRLVANLYSCDSKLLQIASYWLYFFACADYEDWRMVKHALKATMTSSAANSPGYI